MIVDMLAEHQSTIAVIVAICGFAWFVKSKLIEIINNMKSLDNRIHESILEAIKLNQSIVDISNTIKENEIHRNNDINSLSSKFDKFITRNEKNQDKILEKFNK